MMKKEKTRLLCHLGFHEWKYRLRYVGNKAAEFVRVKGLTQIHMNSAALGWEYRGEYCKHCRAFK
jgi:hypothetical protein